MANSKQLVCLDTECTDILKDSSNKSKTVRDAIKFFNKHKDSFENETATTETPVVESKELPEPEVKWF